MGVSLSCLFVFRRSKTSDAKSGDGSLVLPRLLPFPPSSERLDSVLPDQTSLTSIRRTRSSTSIITLPVPTIKRMGRSRQGQGRVGIVHAGHGRRRYPLRRRVRIDHAGIPRTVYVVISRKRSSVGSLPSFRISRKGLSAGEIVFEVVGFVVFLPFSETTEVSRRGLSSGPD